MGHKKKNYGAARSLAIIGALIAMAGFVWGIITVFGTGGNLESIFVDITLQLIGIVVSIFVLISAEFIKKDTKVPFNWWMLLIFVCIQAWMTSFAGFMSLSSLGIILEIIAVILLLIDVL